LRNTNEFDFVPAGFGLIFGREPANDDRRKRAARRFCNSGDQPIIDFVVIRPCEHVVDSNLAMLESGISFARTGGGPDIKLDLTFPVRLVTSVAPGFVPSFFHSVSSIN
jgi:hypothetical protein